MISVIMLTYNREHYIERSICAVLAQTLRDFEYIIVDNGSTDRSGAIADSYAEKDKRIRVLHRQRGTIGAGRNSGLDAAAGAWVAFVDDDDICAPDYLAFLRALAVDHAADVSICGATWADIDEKKIMRPEQAIETLLWRRHYNVAFPTKLVRRTLFDRNRFVETSKYDDIYLMPKILASANRVAYHGLSKYHFDRHGGNNSAWTQNHQLLDAETLAEYLNVYNERTLWLAEKYPANAHKWHYFNWSFMISMVEKVSRLALRDCYTIKRQLVRTLAQNGNAFLRCEYLLDYERKWMEEYVL